MVELHRYKLGQLLDVTRGASLCGEYYSTSGKYIRLTCGNFDYQNNCFKENTSKDNLYYIGDFKPEFLMNEGDIITPLTEQAIGLLGSTAFIPESGKYIQCQDVAKIICNEKLIDKKYAFYLLSSKIVKQQLSVGAQQTKIRHTSPDKIKDCIVWIPNLENQIKIGNLLFEIDRKIALNREINRNLEALARQLYDYWFVQFDFPDENGRPYKSSGGKMVWNEKLKRETPEGWIYRPITTLIKTGKEDANFSCEDGAFPFFTCSQQTLRCNQAVFDCSAIIIAGNGDFNVKHYTGKFNAYQRTYVLEPLKKYYAVSYFSALDKINSFKTGSNGSIIKFITKGDIENILIPVAPLTIYEVLNNLLFKIEYQISEIEELTKQREELLPLLMNGQVNCDLSLD